MPGASRSGMATILQRLLLVPVLAASVGPSLHCAGTPEASTEGGEDIQPQPLPVREPVFAFDLASFAVGARSGGLDVAGRVVTDSALGEASLREANIVAFDATMAGSVVRVTSDATGRFAFTLPEASETDVVYLAFEGDEGSAADLRPLLVRREIGASSVSTRAGCISGSFDFGELARGTRRRFALRASSSCDRSVAVDRLLTTGTLSLASRASPFVVAPQGSFALDVEVTPESQGSAKSYLVLGEGAERHVFKLRAFGL